MHPSGLAILKVREAERGKSYSSLNLHKSTYGLRVIPLLRDFPTLGGLVQNRMRVRSTIRNISDSLWSAVQFSDS